VGRGGAPALPAREEGTVIEGLEQAAGARRLRSSSGRWRRRGRTR
jgi:hypothetical protein